jgi:uncharacterized SAM-binding protein YcdF (DUF218 family)
MRVVVVVAVLAAVAVAALWMQGRMVRKVVRAVVWVGGALVLYVAVTFGQVWFESSRTDEPPSSAIVVLGAAQWNGKPSPVLKARLDHAAVLYEQGVAPTVIVTGAKQAGDLVGEGFAGYDYLRGEGIPESALKIESTGTDTYEELSAAGHILDTEGVVRTVVLVSSPYHAHRAKAIAEEVGLEAHFSGATADEPTLRTLGRETAAVAAGRLISFRRLSNLQPE